MMYRVRLKQTVIETVTLEIETDDPDEVETLAIECARESTDWHFDDMTDGEIDVVFVQKAVRA